MLKDYATFDTVLNYNIRMSIYVKNTRIVLILQCYIYFDEIIHVLLILTTVKQTLKVVQLQFFCYIQHIWFAFRVFCLSKIVFAFWRSRGMAYFAGKWRQVFILKTQNGIEKLSTVLKDMSKTGTIRLETLQKVKKTYIWMLKD